MQPNLINIFQRSQEHSKEVIGILREGSDNRVRDRSPMLIKAMPAK